ncbi:hypothetical protein [Streptomyces cellulosae]|uniref:TetR family transcriptional regulator n=1 Tax=Streptomyces cellulosae TaxID=1968 RepID=A0ABW7YGD1_STRCE
MRITAEQKRQNEDRIRAAMDRLLRGEIPAGGRCDVQTLAAEAQVARAAFYRGRPYEHLRKEFERRLATLRESGEIPDPRDAQIARLKESNAKLKERLAISEAKEVEHDSFRQLALSRLVAQHDEIERLRELLNVSGAVLPLIGRFPEQN